MANYSLLSTNYKLEKSTDSTIKYLVRGLALAPADTAKLRTTCAHATDACIRACVLWFAGRTMMESVRAAMIRRTALYWSNRELFLTKLRSDLARHHRSATKQGLTPVVRLNVASDLPWDGIAREFPTMRFYDYTKSILRMRRFVRGDWPTNYDLTFSYSDAPDSAAHCAEFLSAGANCAAVLSTMYRPQQKRIGALPESIMFDNVLARIVDGDKHDIRLREIDGAGVVIGLRFKGGEARKRAAIESGFCIDVDNFKLRNPALEALASN